MHYGLLAARAHERLTPRVRHCRDGMEIGLRTHDVYSVSVSLLELIATAVGPHQSIES